MPVEIKNLNNWPRWGVDQVKLGADALPIRTLNIAIPFLLMSRYAKPAALGLSAYQLGAGIYQLKDDQTRSQAAGSLAHTTICTGISYFNPVYGALYAGLMQMGVEAKKGRNVKRGVRIASHALYLASLFINRPELRAASMLFQGALEAKQAHTKYKKDKYLEAAGKFTLALIRTWGGVGLAQQTYQAYSRNNLKQELEKLNTGLSAENQAQQPLWQEVERLETGLTRQEFDTLLDYAASQPTPEIPIRIKGSDHGLPRSITLTNHGLYIHLKKKRGMRSIGSGAFKTAYKCLKVEGDHAKLMAELTVHQGIERALKEEQLAREIGSPFIAGAAEVVKPYGNKLSLIEELMDRDGTAYIFQENGSAVNRLRVAEEVAQGVGDLHRAGYVHGDLHTGNILVKLGEEHHGKISDLGLAHKMPGWNHGPRKQDLSHLAEIAAQIVSPVQKQYPEKQSLQELGGFLNSAARWRADVLVRPYELADRLKRCRLELGDRGHIPLVGSTSTRGPSGPSFSKIIQAAIELIVKNILNS